MKILYTGLSSKYIHTMPAGWFLSEYLSNSGIHIDELYLNVNMAYNEILNRILSYDADMLLFSVYIFNVEIIKKLIDNIKLNNPKIIIVVGGPEVTEDFIADHIIIGEGERAILRLIKNGGDKIIKEELIKNLDEIPSPYTEERLIESENKLIYYESSRGCPFKCSYCMASLSSGVRYFSIGRVKEDLTRIVNSGALIIKFTDRTFNVNRKRANEILKFIKDSFYDRKVCFHFEVGGDLFTRSTMDILKTMPKGLIQMEAGVQTLNPLSLKSINREFDIDKFIRNISEIISYNNIHLHLDLIAGLPDDDKLSFINSFNRVISLKPNMLQLGFLKFLKGTPIRENYHAKFNELAPYEVISTPTMDKEDFKELKQVEIVLDRLYNSGKFVNSLNAINYANTYEMFLNISKHFKELGISQSDYEYKLYEGMLSFMKDIKFNKEILRFDFLITNNSKVLPDSLKTIYSETFKKFLKGNKADRDYHYAEFNYLPIEKREGNFIVKFNYLYRNPVNNQYNYEIISDI